MNDRIREEFERNFPPPHDVVYNEEIGEYCWKHWPKVIHPFNDTWDAWRSAIAHMNSYRQEDKDSRMEAQEQLIELRKERAEYGLMIDAALAGKIRSNEPENDGRLKAIRSMAISYRRIKMNDAYWFQLKVSLLDLETHDRHSWCFITVRAMDADHAKDKARAALGAQGSSYKWYCEVRNVWEE